MCRVVLNEVLLTISLHVRHGWSLSETTAASTGHGLSRHEGKDSGGSEKGKEEPEESGRSLELLASLLWVNGAVCKTVGGSVSL